MLRNELCYLKDYVGGQSRINWDVSHALRNLRSEGLSEATVTSYSDHMLFAQNISRFDTLQTPMFDPKQGGALSRPLAGT